MKIRSIFLLLFISCACVRAQESLPVVVEDGVFSMAEMPDKDSAFFSHVAASSAFFRDYLQTGELNDYINYFSDNMLWEGETTGNWTMPERMLFSIRGNSYEWNRFYLDGFRLDSRYLSGSMIYVPDMRETSVREDVQRGALLLTTDEHRLNQISLEGQMGGLGGISPLTKEMINVLHQTAQERAYKPFEQRNHMLWAGQAAASYGIPTHYGDTLYQRVYANAGSRRIVKIGLDGEEGTLDAPFYKVQMEGALPLGEKAFRKDWQLRYLLATQHRPDMFTELGYNANELADYTAYSASVFATHGSRSPRDYRLTTGVTYALHDTRSNERTFERNVVDVDGEGFDPWYADGRLHEASWAVRLDYPIFREIPTTPIPDLNLRLDAYNSLLHFTPTTETWSQQVYCQFKDMPREDWYRYDFTSQAFTSAMLENTIALDLDKDVRSWMALHASLGVTYDAIVLRDKYVGLPSWEAELSLRFHPKPWFKAEVLLGHYRTKYTWNQVRLLSSDYQNAPITGPNAQYAYYGGLFTGVQKGLQQPQYAVLDIPFVFTVAGQHEFSVLSTARVYYHMWQIVNNPSATLPYLMAEQQPVAGAGLFALPLYLSNTLKYAYNGKKVFFSLSWQSYQMSGLSTLGNGAENNSIGSLTYSMLNPSTYENLSNTSCPQKALGRLDQDKAYICRVQMGANITPNWQLMANFHWQDGTPVSNYRVHDGNIWQNTTKGINPVNGHFGQRKDMFFNLDIRLGYRGNINMLDQTLGAAGAVPFRVDLSCYNIYDFGTEWYEYSFDQNLEHGRRSVAICIPRGLRLSLSIGLP